MPKKKEIITIGTEISDSLLEAQQLHVEIITSGQLVADSIVAYSRNLKRMKDTGLYTELGLNSFEEYCEQREGIKQRQAYNFIRVIEELGESYVTVNARLGITKLVELARLDTADRETLESTVDVESVTTKELREKVAELTKKNEQLKLDCDDLKARYDELESELDEDGEDETPQSEIDLEKIRQEERYAVRAEIEAQEAEAKKLTAELEEVKKQNKILQSNAKTQKAEKPAGGSKELLKLYFERVQTEFNAAYAVIKGLEEAEREKYRGGFEKLLNTLLGALSEV